MATEFYDTLTGLAVYIDAGFAFALVLVLSFWFLGSIIAAIHQIFLDRWAAARCQGFHNHSIKGRCRCHRCPYSWQCDYYLPRQSFRRRVAKEVNYLKYRFGFAQKGKGFIDEGIPPYFDKKEEP